MMYDQYNQVMTTVGNCVVDWYECGENPAIFCYRIGAGIFSNVREWADEAAPGWHVSAKETLECLNRYGNYSMRCTTLKG